MPTYRSFTKANRSAAKLFIERNNAQPIGETILDTQISRVYKINHGSLPATIWLETESRLEEPEYFYSLTYVRSEPQ